MAWFPNLLCLLAVFVTGCATNRDGREHHASSAKPNIIYIYADDLGYGELGVYGQQKIRTPHLDRMAAEGIRFTQHYTATPVCAPARCALLTGKHTGHAYIRGNRELGQFSDAAERGQWPLPEGTTTIGTLLQQAGYVTAAIGKWGLGMTGNSGHPNKQGFDYFYGYLDQKQAHNYYPTHLWENTRWDSLPNPFIFVHNPRDNRNGPNKEAIEAFANQHLGPGDAGFFDAYKGEVYAIDAMSDKAEQFIRRYQDSAFFLYLPFTIPHVSLQVPDPALDQYVGKFEETPYLGQQGYSPHRYPLSAYAAMISALDAEVGKIFALLKELGLDDKTLVMFSSDNGPTFNGGVNAEFFESSAGLRGLKMDVYEGGIRVPMLARWPGRIKAGSTTDHPSAQYDVLATLSEVAGIGVSKDTDGISFLPTLLGTGRQEKHAFLYFEYPEKGGQVAVRMDNWKGVKTNLRSAPDGRWELYDLQRDRSETTNLAGEHPDVLGELDGIVRREHSPSIWEHWNFVDSVIERSSGR